MPNNILRYGNDILLSPSYSNSLYVPPTTFPDRYLYDPYGVSGVMCNLIATGEGANITGESVLSAQLDTGYGSGYIRGYMSGSDNIIEHSGKECRLYLKNATCLNTWRGSYWWQDWPARDEAMSSMHLIFSADFMLGYSGRVTCHMNSSSTTTHFSAIDLSGSNIQVQPTPVAFVEGTQTAKNGSYRAASTSHYWYRNVGENPSANWYNVTRVMTYSSTNQWYHNGTLSIDEKSDADLWYAPILSSVYMNGPSKMRNFRMIYFASAKAQEVYDNWSACSASYPSGIMPEYIAQKKPII